MYVDNVQKIYQVTEDFRGFVELRRTYAETFSSSLFVNFRSDKAQMARLSWLFNHVR
jgi:hypothetical protein